MLAFGSTTFPPSIRTNPSSDIYLRDSHGKKSKIRKMSSSTPNKGLGCHQAVDGNILTEYTHCIKQCRQVSSRARSAWLTFYEAKSMLELRITPQVTYSMSLTTFTTLQCSNMNIIIDRTMLNKMGTNCNMLGAVVYSPLRWGGMNYPNFQIIQDQKGILYLLQQVRW